MQTAGSATTMAIRRLRHGIAYHRSRTWHWQDVAGRPRTLSSHAERHTSSVAYLAWIDRLWSRRRIRARRFALSHPLIPHKALWMCIHGLEAGDWHNEDTGGNGHYGGLQMHWSWGYGISGDPASYSEQAQLASAERGYRASGYSEAWLMGRWNHPECLAYR